jgi:hypothetical protein
VTTFTLALSDTATGTANPLNKTYFMAADALVLAVVSERGGVGSAAHAVSDDDGGTWVKRFAVDQELGDANARHSLSVWQRTAGPTGENTIVSFSDGTTNTRRQSVLQVQADGAYDWAFEAFAAAHSGTADWSGLNSGDTDSVSGSDLFSIAIGGCRNSSGGSIPSTISFDPHTDAHTNFIGANNALTHTFAMQASGQASGVKTATITSNGSGNEGIVGVLVFSGAGAGGINADLDATDAPDAAGIAGSVAIGADLSAADAPDVAGMAASLAIAAALDATDAGQDAAALVAGVSIGGTLAATEAGQDAAAASAGVGIGAALAGSDAPDLADLGAGVAIAAALEMADAADAAALAGTVAIGGTLAATGAADLAAMTAGVGVSGIAAVLDATEAPDGAALAASVGIGAGLDASDLGQDAATLAGAMAIAAVLDTMDSPDAATLAGSVGISGALDATEAGQDAVALAGLVFIAAALDAQETGWDVFAANDLSAPLPLPLPALWRDKPRVAAWPDAPRGALWHDQPRRATWRAA